MMKDGPDDPEPDFFVCLATPLYSVRCCMQKVVDAPQGLVVIAF